MRYVIQTEQAFNVTFVVEADNPDEAWDTLISCDGDVECEYQIPGAIIATREESSIEEAP